jgi:hypothetical protein
MIFGPQKTKSPGCLKTFLNGFLQALSKGAAKAAILLPPFF